MDKKIIKRVKEESIYILTTKATLRNVAQKFKVSKSTVHKDMNERLNFISPQMKISVQEILNNHLEMRHLRGGESTKLKYKQAEKIEGNKNGQGKICSLY